MNIKTIDLNGRTLRVAIRTGLANTTPLLMFNGIGASLELVLPFVMALHPDLEVIVFDIPGIGGSTTPDIPYRFSNMANTVVQMLDRLGYDQVDVIGLSWGGFLAQQFAHDYPARCRKLILAATSSGADGVAPTMKVLGLMGSPRRYTDAVYAASIAPEIYGGQFRHDPVLALTHAKKMVADKAKTQGTDQGYYFQLFALIGWTSRWWNHKIKQPTLLLAGNDDPIIPLANMERLAKRIPNSILRVFDDGHLFLLTDLPKVMPLITAFLLPQHCKT